MEQKDIFASLKNMQFLDRDLIKPNGYNPNHVMKQNMEYLKQSILANGFCFPIVIRPDYTIIDGYHRWLDGGDAKRRTYRAFLFGIHQSLVKKHKDGK